ncbi:hypothetical protein, partial [Xenorhabdus szentirmaii]|uniref:hypothetical protein n=1 Tax=Xenorhabdus szentirmaii TaxID=290112 RepID=UPI002B4039AF
AGLNRGNIGALVVLIFPDIRNLGISAAAGELTALKGNVTCLPCHRLVILVFQHQLNVGQFTCAGFQRPGVDGQRRRFVID